MTRNKTGWSYCWKCEGNIDSQSDCNYLKCRDGNYDLCPKCYDLFLSHNVEFIRPEQNKKDEIHRSLNIALSNFHDSMVEEGRPIGRASNNTPTLLVHRGEYWRDCESCKEILTLIKD